jgi:hypothetical protein
VVTVQFEYPLGLHVVFAGEGGNALLAYDLVGLHVCWMDAVQLAVWTPKHGPYLAASRCEAAVMAHPQVEWCPDHGYHFAAVAAPRFQAAEVALDRDLGPQAWASCLYQAGEWELPAHVALESAACAPPTLALPNLVLALANLVPPSPQHQATGGVQQAA